MHFLDPLVKEIEMKINFNKRYKKKITANYIRNLFKAVVV